MIRPTKSSGRVLDTDESIYEESFFFQGSSTLEISRIMKPSNWDDYKYLESSDIKAQDTKELAK